MSVRLESMGALRGNLFAGIDAGQSSTIALVAGEDGIVVGRGASGPADEIGEGPGSRRLAGALEDALHAALIDAGIDPRCELAVVVAGISGYEGALAGDAPRLRARRIRLLHDAPVALAAAIDGPGIVLIAGTGSIAYGEDGRGRIARAGGWGYLFGDRGSAFWTARCAVSAALRAADAGAPSVLGDAVLAHFGVPDLRALVQAYYAGTLSRAQLAGFAPLVVRAAAAGNSDATAILERGAAALAELVEQVRGRLDFGARVQVALSGGLFADDAFTAATVAAVKRGDADVDAARSGAEPAAGALRLALREAGGVAGAKPQG